jgi:prevent-host-death family protein
MTMTAEVGEGQLAELIKQVQAGNDVLLTVGNKTVAKLLPAEDQELTVSSDFQIRSFQGHRVLTPTISQAELVEEVFSAR